MARSQAHESQNPRRRRFLRRALLGGAALAAGVTAARYAHPLRRREISVALPRLPARFRGFRIGLVADMHRSPVVSQDQCRLAASLLRGASCDVIVNLGDNVSWWAGYAPSALAAFRDLHPPAGKFAVLGNHEHWTGVSRGRRALTQAGFHLLVNDHAALTRDGERLYLVGVDDLWAGRPDFGAAFRDIPDDACVIVLSHNPDAIYDKRVRRADLVLSGHTHGGQILGATRITAPFMHCRYGRLHPHGLYREGQARVYVTSGVGLGGIFCIRIGVPPEVAVISLIPAAGSRA